MSRWEKLHPGDQTYLTNLVAGVYDTPLSRISDVVAGRIHDFRQGTKCDLAAARALARSPDFAQHQLASQLDFAASAVVQRSISERLIENAPERLVRGIKLANRLNYVADLFKSEAYSGGDSYHVIDTLLALSVFDVTTALAFAQRHHKRVKKGHPWTVKMCNLVTAILLRRESDYSSLQNEPSRPSYGQYYCAMLDAGKAIISKDEIVFSSSVQAILKLHGRTSKLDGALRFFCKDAHALASLWQLSHSDSSVDPKAEWTSAPHWDQETYELALRDAFEKCDTSPIHAASQFLGELADGLPLTIAPSEISRV